MPKRAPDDFARIAYEAYGAHVGWTNYLGRPMPAWDQVGERIQGAWRAACEAVIDDLLTPPGYETRAGTANSFGRHAAAAGGGGDGDVVV